MEWRDIAMILIGVLSGVTMLLYAAIKERLESKSDKDHVIEDRRRLNEHDSSIGSLFSKLHDAEMDRSKMHLEIVQALNANHLTLLDFLRTQSGNHQ